MNVRNSSSPRSRRAANGGENGTDGRREETHLLGEERAESRVGRTREWRWWRWQYSRNGVRGLVRCVKFAGAPDASLPLFAGTSDPIPMRGHLSSLLAALELTGATGYLGLARLTWASTRCSSPPNRPSTFLLHATHAFAAVAVCRRPLTGKQILSPRPGKGPGASIWLFSSLLVCSQIA